MEGCLLETFRWDLKWDMLLETFETFQTYHRELLTWNFQMRLEMRCAIRNFWNFSNLSWRVAYLKLSDETWNEMRCAIRNFWNLSKLSWSVAYWKLSDETWNEMCYLKLLKLVKAIMEGCLFETFRWDLKWDMLLETFETFQTYHRELLTWNFQMRLEMRCAIRNFWNFSNLSWRVPYLKLSDETWNEMRCAIRNFWNVSNLSWSVAYWKLSDETWNEMCYLKLLKLVKAIMGGCLFETFRWDLKWDMLLETFETCQNYHGGLLIWNFQMRLEMRCAVWNFWNISNLSWRVAYWKLSDETWNEMCY